MAAVTTPLISNWHPDITYDFTLRIGENDYSTDLVKVEIKTSITTPYQYLLLDININADDILENSLFGQDPIKLIIRLIGKDKTRFGNDIVFDLMYIDTMTEYRPTQQQGATDQQERTVTKFKTVCIKAYQTMSTMINKIYFNKTPDTIITDLVSQTGAELEYDSAGKSTLKIDQLLIPPTTLYNIINYIDRIYGLFNGPMAVYSTYDNKIKIQNLNKKPNMAQMITLYLIATDNDETKIFNTDDPTIFYSTEAVGSSYKGNAVFAIQAPTIKYIVKPRDSLSKIHKVSLVETAQQYGVIEKNNSEIYFNKTAINTSTRIGFEKDQTGYDDDKTFIHSNLSQNILDMSTVMADVSGNLPVLNLMAVGEHVKIISHTDTRVKLSGSYILKGSSVSFMKAMSWEAHGRIFLARSNIAQQ